MQLPGRSARNNKEASEYGWMERQRKRVVGDEIQEVLKKADHGKDFAQS